MGASLHRGCGWRPCMRWVHRWVTPTASRPPKQKLRSPSPHTPVLEWATTLALYLRRCSGSCRCHRRTRIGGAARRRHRAASRGRTRIRTCAHERVVVAARGRSFVLHLLYVTSFSTAPRSGWSRLLLWLLPLTRVTAMSSFLSSHSCFQLYDLC